MSKRIKVIYIIIYQFIYFTDTCIKFILVTHMSNNKY